MFNLVIIVSISIYIWICCIYSGGVRIDSLLYRERKRREEKQEERRRDEYNSKSMSLVDNIIANDNLDCGEDKQVYLEPGLYRSCKNYPRNSDECRYPSEMISHPMVQISFNFTPRKTLGLASSAVVVWERRRE